MEVKSKAEFKDRQKAREMQQAALGQEDKFSKRFIYYLTSFLIITGIGYLFMVSFLVTPKENQRIVDTALGFIMGTVISSVIAFFYSSTKTSNEKTQQIVKLASTGGDTTIIDSPISTTSDQPKPEVKE